MNKQKAKQQGEELYKRCKDYTTRGFPYNYKVQAWIEYYEFVICGKSPEQ